MKYAGLSGIIRIWYVRSFYCAKVVTLIPISVSKPWTGTLLYTAKWNNGAVEEKKLIAGKAQAESISQPRWNIDGSLFFVSDRTGFWQLYHLEDEDLQPKHLKLEGLENAEFSGK